MAVSAGTLEGVAARGRTSLMGPVDYSTNYACGLLVDGFATPPRVMMNHNPPYYAGLLESYGLAKSKDLYAWWFDDPHDICNKWQRRVERSAGELRGDLGRRPDGHWQRQQPRDRARHGAPLVGGRQRFQRKVGEMREEEPVVRRGHGRVEAEQHAS